MAFVWKHPSITAFEILWRWLATVPLLWFAWRVLHPKFTAVPLDTSALASMTFFEPVRSVSLLARGIRPYFPALERTGTWWIPLALLAWTAAATLGRTTILRRAARLWPPSGAHAERRSPAQRHPVVLPQTAIYTLVRVLAFLLLISLWLFGLLAAVRSTVLDRVLPGAEPNLVLLTAEAIALTLAAFLLWSATVYPLDLRPIERVTGLRIRTGSERRQLRSKLIETNLVMGIVRVILFVLALTFSASPLPFQSRETQAFINLWWVGVATFYVLGSDFFHVVRRVTYLQLLETIAAETDVPARTAS